MSPLNSPRWSVLVLVTIATLIIPAAAGAAPPVNDDFANPIGVGVPVRGTATDG